MPLRFAQGLTDGRTGRLAALTPAQIGCDFLVAPSP